MHDHESIARQRVERALTRVKEAIYGPASPVSIEAWAAPGEPVPFAQARDAAYEKIDLPFDWGAAWSTWWFRLHISELPDGEGRPDLIINPGFVGDWPGNQAEGLLYTSDGDVLKAINPQNNTWSIPDNIDLPLTLYFEAAANPDIMAKGWKPTPQGDRLTARQESLYRFTTAHVSRCNDDVWQLFFDMEVALGLAKELPAESTRRAELITGLERACARLDLSNVDSTAAQARGELAALLDRPAHASAQTLHAVGHAHIDCAWLWPVRETKRKVVRTFANVLWLMRRYEDFRFACSSAQQYAWLRESHPEMLDEIVAAARRGQWIPVGGMWVEPDGNLPSGESLLRQLFYGQREFVDIFGKRCEGMWIPDSFGYTAAYPQIARHAEMSWFLTQKISWNQTNTFPHHSFWWEGIDGTRLFTHFCPVNCYDSIVSPEELVFSARNFRDKGAASHALLPFGHGDGGGGPIPAMMERARRARDCEGLPRVRIDSPNDFFAQAITEYGQTAPTWAGELYLELHRGTLTSEAQLKWGNRRTEAALHTAEFVWTLSMLAGGDYPHEEIDDLWRRALLLQFHDILPGSSIAWVHREAREAYDALAADLTDLIDRGLAAAGLSGQGRLLNPGPAGGRGLPAYGTGTRRMKAGYVRRSGLTVESDRLVVTFASDGTLARVVDKEAQRQILGGDAAVLALYDDLPNNWDAWDLDRHHRDRRVELRDASEIVWEEDEERVSAVVTRRQGTSTIQQRVIVSAGSSWIDIDLECDWHEQEKLLTLEIPLAMLTRETIAETQFGYVRRPSVENTSWDYAAFERCQHRWVRVEEGGYGVSIANDATYGYSTRREQREGRSVTRICQSLLRAPTFPDPNGNPGVHRRRFALGFGVDLSETIAKGYELNVDLLDVGSDVTPMFDVDGEGVYIETVKAAHDGSGDVIARVYEGHGATVRAVITPGFTTAGAIATNVYEEESETVPQIEVGADGSVTLTLTPHALATIRWIRKGNEQ